MNWRIVVLGLVLIDFTALCAYAVWTHGYLGVLAWTFESPAAMVFAADLVIALALVTLWMWRDARQQGRSPVPYVALTLALGSVGPLLYLIARELGPRAAPTPAFAPRG